METGKGEVLDDQKAAHKKPPPHVIAIIIFLFVTLYFALICVPFLAASSNPDRNMGRFNVLIADFDGGFLGRSVVSFYQSKLQTIMPLVSLKLGGTSTALPTFTVVTDVTSIDDLKSRVANNEAWAAVYINAGSSTALLNVVASGCINVKSYVPGGAFGIIYEEGRAQGVASKIVGLLQSTLGMLSSYLSSVVLQGGMFTPTQILECLTSTSTGTDSAGSPGSGGVLLATPVDYTVTNLSPTYLAPVMNTAFGVGNILIAVFSSLYVVMAVMKGIGPLEEWSVVNRFLFRTLCCFMYAFGLAVVFATTCVGLIKDGSGNISLSGNQWAQLFAIQFVHGSIWIFGNMALAIGLTPDILGLPFAFFLISNIIGGFAMDFADSSFQNFYQIFPFNFAIILMRNTVYGSMPGLATRNAAGALCGEAVFFFLCFVIVSLRQTDSPAEAKRAVDGPPPDTAAEPLQ